MCLHFASCYDTQSLCCKSATCNNIKFFTRPQDKSLMRLQKGILHQYAKAPPTSKILLNLHISHFYILGNLSSRTGGPSVWMDVGPNSKPNPAQISTDCMMIFDICVLALAHVIPESRRSTNSSFPLLALLRNHTSPNPDIQTTSRTRNTAIKE